MGIQIHTPPPPLSRFVETIWYITNAGGKEIWERIYPQGSMELVVHLDSRELSFIDEAKRHSVRVPLLAGPYSRSFLINPAEYTAVIGARFRPGAARMFFPVPAHELRNTDVPVEQLYPREAERLYDQLLSARGAAARIHVLEQYLRSKLVRSTELHPVVEYAVREFSRSHGAAAVADIRRETGLSHTRFIQIFTDHVGLTPKVFSRLQRFRALLEQVDRKHTVNWAEAAVMCGYFDQAHLIRDFRSFAATTPAAWLQSRSGS